MGLVAVKCPQCGADIQLDDTREFGYCSFCGTKVMQDRILVEHSGTVRIDSSDNLKNLYQAARNALATSNSALALRHYETISTLDPNSWEALFYSVVLKTEKITNGEIGSAAESVQLCLGRVFELLSSYVPDEAERKEAVSDITSRCVAVALKLTSASYAFYKSLTQGNGVMAFAGISGLVTSVSSTQKAFEGDVHRRYACANILIVCAEAIESFFDVQEKEYNSNALLCYRTALALDDDCWKTQKKQHIYNENAIRMYRQKIRDLEANVPQKAEPASSPSAEKSTPQRTEVTEPQREAVAYFPNAQSGVKVLRASIILALSESGVALLSLLLLVLRLNTFINDAAFVMFGGLKLLRSLIQLASYICQIVGIVKISKDGALVKRALYFVIPSMICCCFGGFLSAIGVSLVGAATFFVMKGIDEMVQSTENTNTLKVLLVVSYSLSALSSISSMIASTTLAMSIALVAFAAAVAFNVMYLNYLQKKIPKLDTF